LFELGVSISITERRQGGDKGPDEFPCAEKERERGRRLVLKDLPISLHPTIEDFFPYLKELVLNSSPF